VRRRDGELGMIDRYRLLFRSRLEFCWLDLRVTRVTVTRIEFSMSIYFRGSATPGEPDGATGM
jgi:hypothetical protein